MTVSTKSNMSYSFCSFKKLSPEDALEIRLLLDSIAWPETPPLSVTVPLEESSDPANSTFTILPRRAGGQWYVGDQLEVMIKMYDFQGRPKKSGGDFLVARLHSPILGAGVTGQVVDHLNGSYSAVFSLLWEGSAQVEVTLKLLCTMWLFKLTISLAYCCHASQLFHSCISQTVLMQIRVVMHEHNHIVCT